MRSARLQSWVWLLLPLLVARALMPVGFMAQVHDGKLQIVLCSAGFTKALTTGHADNSKHDVAQHDGYCPFAHAAAAPLLEISGSEAITFVPSAAIIPPADTPYYAVGPPRQHLARGPPTHA